jgi:hypothetical protein
MIWLCLALMINVLLQNNALNIRFGRTTFNTPHTMSTIVFIDFSTIMMRDNWNPIMTSNNGQKPSSHVLMVISMEVVLAHEYKKINQIMSMQIPFWCKGEICASFLKSKNFSPSWCTPKILEIFECESENENNERRSWSMFPNS